MKRKKLILANWKMNMNIQQASLLLHRLHERIQIHRDIEIVLATSYLHLHPLSQQIDRRKFKLGAQNAHFEDKGPFTGEVSFSMLHDLASYSLVGHSERRIKFGESLDDVKKKVAAAFRNGITPVLCIGEQKSERLAGETKQVIHDQLISALSDITAEEVAEMVIAYEPIWAISNGTDFHGHEIASPDDAASMAAYIRMQISSVYGEYAANAVRVMYGASVTSANARAFMDADGIDGVLVGGASLNYQEFAGIVQAAYRSLHDVKAVVGG
jgi:triosephosphate isomerase (TIM)